MIYFGDTELYGVKIGNTDISAIYAGDLLIWPTSVTGWSVEPATIEMASSGGTERIKIASLSAWTISSSESWVTFSQNSGDSGRSTVIATIASYTGSADRTATITVTDGTNVSTIGVTQAKYVATLPMPFVFNFNAKDYKEDTRVITRHPDATLPMNMQLGKTVYSAYTGITSAITAYDDHIHFSGGTYAQLGFADSAGSPFNITTSSPNMTLIVKFWRDPDAASVTPGTGNKQSDLIANRGNSGNTYNWMARMSEEGQLYLHTATVNGGVSATTWSANPTVVVYRIDNKNVYIKNITENLLNTPFTPEYNGGTNRTTFFGQGYQNNPADVRNLIGGDFYWAYLTREVLTDAEIQQVIDYNDGIEKINYSAMPLTFEILSDGIINWKARDASITKTISYSRDNGVTWTSITSTTAGTSFNVVAGEKIQFKGTNSTYCGTATSLYNTFSGSTADYNAYGNIMSLIYGDNYSGQTTLTGEFTFRCLFQNSNLIDASNLILPATTLVKQCYSGMFSPCPKLIAAPSLPAKTMTESCYINMFMGCSALTQSPELPATTLAKTCYQGFLASCPNIVYAPVLPATTLVTGCYQYMFQNCTSLRYITVLSNSSGSSYTTNWVSGVPNSSGRFFIRKSSTSWGTGKSGRPSSWTQVTQ